MSFYIIPDLQDVTWTGITDKPETFPPSSHTHAIDDVDGLLTKFDDYWKSDGTSTATADWYMNGYAIGDVGYLTVNNGIYSNGVYLYDQGDIGYYSYGHLSLEYTKYIFLDTYGAKADVEVKSVLLEDTYSGGSGRMNLDASGYWFTRGDMTVASITTSQVNFFDANSGTTPYVYAAYGNYFFTDGVGGYNSNISVGGLSIFNYGTYDFMKITGDGTSFIFLTAYGFPTDISIAGLRMEDTSIGGATGMISLYSSVYTFKGPFSTDGILSCAGIINPADQQYAFDAVNRAMVNSSGFVTVSADYHTLYNNGGAKIDWSGNRASTTPISLSGNDPCYVGKTLYYQNIATVGNGQPVLRATVDLSSQSTAKTATTLYTVPASAGGMYRVSLYSKETRAATTSSTLGGTNGFRVIHTDFDDSVVTTSGNIANNSGANLSANTTQVTYIGSVVVNAKSGTNIQYSYDYTSSGATTMQYNLHLKVEQL